MFKLNTTPGKESALLTIPESCVDKIIFGGYEGIIKMYLTTNEKILIPDLIHYLRAYMKDVIYVNYIERRNFSLDSYNKG